MGQVRSKAVTRLAGVISICAAVFGHAAQADECACAVSNAPNPNNVQPASAAAASTNSPSAAAAVTAYAAAQRDLKKSEKPDRKFTPKSGATNFALRLIGSDANTEINPDSLKAGETSHKYVGVELGGNLDSLMKTQLQMRFTEAQSDPGKALFDLQPGGQNSDARRALQDFSAATSFLGERLTLSSYERSSSFALMDTAGGNTKGEVEQHHLAAALWRSDNADFDFDAALSKTSSNYWDFGDSPDADLHANNNRVSQYRSKLRLDRFGLSVIRRDASALAAPSLGEVLPSRSETEAKLSLDVADLRDGLGVGAAYSRLLPLPDSVWIGANHGALVSDDLAEPMHETVEKLSMGASRNISYGTLNASFWQSMTQPTGDALVGYRGTGHGIDLGSNLNFGALGFTGSIGLIDQQNFFAGNESDISTLNGSLFVTWQTPLGVGLRAGMTRNSTQNEFADYGGLDNSAFRYQVAVDLSHL
ncbi:MAG TPA: hypothetical protein VNH44_11080, partial [Micropepsaceae bacterium]|nr:hypothetical protein [Micropepsaceae bacterium]